MVTISEFSTTSTGLFFTGFFGIFTNRKNIIILIMSLELMLLGSSLNFIIYSTFLDDFMGQLFSICILAIAGAEGAIGLSLLVLYYRVKGSISILSLNKSGG
jgi:NADH-quinone oxidoreductase subunit K